MLTSFGLRRARIQVIAWAALAAVACLLLLSACGGSSAAGTDTGGNSGGGNTGGSGGATLSMDSFSFSGAKSVTIKAGQAVTFTSSGTHELVIGTDGKFTAQSGAPTELNSDSGLMISSGDSKSITFPTAGTYNITCKIHPSMQATVIVQ